MSSPRVATWFLDHVSFAPPNTTPCGKSSLVNNVLPQSPVIQPNFSTSHIVDSRAITRYRGQPPAKQSLVPRISSHSARLIQKQLEASLIPSSSKDPSEGELSPLPLNSSQSPAPILPLSPPTSIPDNALRRENPANSLARARFDEKEPGNYIDWNQVQTTIFSHYPWVLRSNNLVPRDLLDQSRLSSQRTRTISTEKSTMAPSKRKAIEIADQGIIGNQGPTALGRPPRALLPSNGTLIAGSLEYQAATREPALQGTAQPPKSSRLQYQPHQHPAVLGARIRRPRHRRRAPSRPPTPVGIWKSAAAFRRRKLPSIRHTVQWKPINRPIRDSLAPARDVHLGVIGHQHQSTLKGLAVLNAHLGSRGAGSGASPEAAQPSPAPVNMTPMNTVKPSNGFVPVNRSPNAPFENPAANLGQGSGQAVLSTSKPGASQSASQPGSQHNVSTPASGPRNLSVVINSGPKAKIPPHMVFDPTESDEENALKSPSKSAKDAPARKVRAKRASMPKASGQASANEKPAPAAAKPVAKKRGRKAKDQEGTVKEKVAKKPTSKFPVPKDFDSEIPLPKANYNVYICEWKGCPAELHNLETLRRHVYVEHNHKLPCGGRECLWAECATKSQSNIPSEEKEVECAAQSQSDIPSEEKKVGGDLNQTAKFDTETQWKKHIEDKHMVPISWQMGDGPKVSPLIADSLNPTQPEIPRWLCDENGVQVTPSIEGQPIEDGDITELNRKRYKKTRVGLDVVYDPVMDRKLWWKMPDDPDYMMPRMRLN